MSGRARPTDPTSSTGADRPRQRGVRAALASLAPPEPAPDFWEGIEGELDDQAQLDIVTRPAVRSITEPPPISQPTLDDDPRHALAAYRPSGAIRRDPTRPRSTEDDAGSRRRRLAVVCTVAAVLAVLGATSVLGGDDPAPPNLTTTTANPGAPVGPGQPATPPAAVVPGLDPAAALTAAGIGPVLAGMTLGQLEDAGVTIALDQATYDASGATCFDVGLPAAPDLTLRFRSPEALVPVEDRRDGILASINVDAGIGSTRLTDAAIGLGTTEEQLRAAYDNLEVSDQPSRPGSYVFLARAGDGSGMAIAYVTDGAHVTEISVGEVEVVRLRQTCS